VVLGCAEGPDAALKRRFGVGLSSELCVHRSGSPWKTWWPLLERRGARTGQYAASYRLSPFLVRTATLEEELQAHKDSPQYGPKKQ